MRRGRVRCGEGNEKERKGMGTEGKGEANEGGGVEKEEREDRKRNEVRKVGV